MCVSCTICVCWVLWEELQIAMSHHVGAGKQTQPLCICLAWTSSLFNTVTLAHAPTYPPQHPKRVNIQTKSLSQWWYTSIAPSFEMNRNWPKCQANSLKNEIEYSCYKWSCPLGAKLLITFLQFFASKYFQKNVRLGEAEHSVHPSAEANTSVWG